MRAGRVEEASALAKLIGKDIVKENSRKLNRIQGAADSKELWSAVRHITGRTRQTHNITGIDAETLNSHYANVSTDSNYTPPSLKLTAVSDDQDYISEWSVFKALDTLRPTATGLDRIQAWFLRLGAAVFCKPLEYLFNQSIASSSVPLQWKQAMISPVAKIPCPRGCSDFKTNLSHPSAHTCHGKTCSPSVFTVRRYALHGLSYRNSVRPSVCPSVCLSHLCTVSTWFDLRS